MIRCGEETLHEAEKESKIATGRALLATFYWPNRACKVCIHPQPYKPLSQQSDPQLNEFPEQINIVIERKKSPPMADLPLVLFRDPIIAEVV